MLNFKITKTLVNSNKFYFNELESQIIDEQ
jgi:hypothetical protein